MALSLLKKEKSTWIMFVHFHNPNRLLFRILPGQMFAQGERSFAQTQ